MDNEARAKILSVARAALGSATLWAFGGLCTPAMEVASVVELRALYVAARNAFVALSAINGVDATQARHIFASDVLHVLGCEHGFEVVTKNAGGGEVVAAKRYTPTQYANAAQAVVAEFADSYCIAEVLRPGDMLSREREDAMIFGY